MPLLQEFEASTVSTENRSLSTNTDKQVRDLCILGWLFLAAALVLFALRPPKGNVGDFVYFYSIGHLLNEHSFQHLYVYEVQQKIFNEVKPTSHDKPYGPSPYPPYVALFFRTFAKLPFLAAYRVWMLLALSFYIAGLWMLLRAFLPGCGRIYWLACFCGALLYWPFLGWTLLSGNWRL